VTPGTNNVPVSTRRIFNTILDFAGIDKSSSLLNPQREVILGEAMKPYLDYGWQPQVMGVDGKLKTILAGRAEVYDVVADPNETKSLSDVPRDTRAAISGYPIPSLQEAATAGNLDEESRRQLAS